MKGKFLKICDEYSTAHYFRPVLVKATLNCVFFGLLALKVYTNRAPRWLLSLLDSDRLHAVGRCGVGGDCVHHIHRLCEWPFHFLQ